MKRRPIRPTLVAAMLAFAAPLAAQERDAQVLRWGEFRLTGGIEFLHAAERFGDGGRESLAADYSIPLTAGSFVPLASANASLRAFLRATEEAGDPDFDAAPLTAGDLALEVGSASRIVPIGLRVGILPRLEIGATLPLVWRERRPRRVETANANVGLNPDPEANAALLQPIDPTGGVLGSSAVLPLAGTPAAEELQRRVQALTGQSLTLPTTPLTARELVAELAAEPLDVGSRPWALGDLELHARFQPLHSFGGRYYPDSPGVNYRLALGAGLRLPTGRPSEDPLALAIEPDQGIPGYSADAALDLFVGDRFWLTTAGRLDGYGDVDAVLWPPAAVLSPIVGGAPVLVHREPGIRIEVAALPRVWLTREMSAGLAIVHVRAGSDLYRLPDIEFDTPARSRTSAGFALRYSTIPARESGRSIIPIEFAVGYTGAIAGSGDIPATGTVFFQGSVVPRLWGGRPAE